MIYVFDFLRGWIKFFRLNLACEEASPLSHTRERRIAKRSGSKESGKEAPRIGANVSCSQARLNYIRNTRVIN